MSKMVSASLLAVLLFSFFCGAVTMKLDDRPEMPELRSFPKRDGKAIDLALEIAADYRPFGICLLDDSSGTKMANIYAAQQGNPMQINDAVFVEWLAGKGKRPVKWSTFLDCVRKISLYELEGEIVEEMEDKRGKRRDRVLEEHHQPVLKTHTSTDDDSHPIEDKLELLSALTEVGNWDVLCTHLGVSDALMNTIRQNVKDISLKREECLRHYFNTDSADWGHVVTSVAEPPIGNRRLACKIALKHMGMDRKECHTYLGHNRDEL